MDFVDDEDLVAVADRRHPETRDDDVADLVDPGMRGSVDLEDVHVAPLSDLAAGVALTTRVGGRPLVAIEAAGKDASGRRLADPARAGEHERLCNAADRDRVAQRLRHATLTDHVVESLRAPLAGENLVTGHR